MHLIVLGLKILLWILLAVIGLALLVLVLILAVPIRYRIRGEKEEYVNGYAGLHWLFHFLSIALRIEQGKVTFGKIRIAGITLADFTPLPIEEEAMDEVEIHPQPDGKTDGTSMSVKVQAEGAVDAQTLLQDAQRAAEKHKSKRVQARQEKKEQKRAIQAQKEKERLAQRRKAQLQKEKEKEEQRRKLKEAKEQEKEARKRKKLQEKLQKRKQKHAKKKQEAVQKSRKPRSLRQKVQDRWQRICMLADEALNRVDQGIDRVADLSDQIFDKMDAIEEVLADAAVRQVWGKLWKAVRKIVHHLLPVKGGGSLQIGLTEPAATGRLCGILAMGMPFYGKSWKIEPDFTQQIATGTIDCRGRIRLGYVVWRLLLLIANKEFWYAVRRVKELRSTAKTQELEKDRKVG